MKNPLSHQWNLEIQQTVGDNLLLSVAYVGSTSRRLDYTPVVNTPTIPGDPASIPYPYMTSTFFDQTTASGNYNGLQARVERRFKGGLQYLISYTWSKSIDDGGSGMYNAESGPGGYLSAVQDSYNRMSNRAVSAYDIPQMFSMQGIWEVPFGKGKKWVNAGPGSYLLGNWQLNGILQAHSGQPFTLQVAGDIANLGNGATAYGDYGRPNQISSNVYPSKQTAQEWYNPAAFSIPVGTYGNFDRDALRSSSVYSLDFSLFRKFPIGETKEFQLRFEFFNIMNVQSLGPPAGLYIGQPNAGVVSSLATGLYPREIQFGLKFQF
jgi:hypothetical protein